jgi:hypothetical protein
MGSLYPIAIAVDASHLKSAFRETKVRRAEAKQFEAKPFEPDYLCFLAHAHTVLDYVHEKHLHVERVDFIVEQKNYVTRYINEFHSTLAAALKSIGRPDLSPLVGTLNVGDKERIPLPSGGYPVLARCSMRKRGRGGVSRHSRCTALFEAKKSKGSVVRSRMI